MNQVTMKGTSDEGTIGKGDQHDQCDAHHPDHEQPPHQGGHIELLNIAEDAPDPDSVYHHESRHDQLVIDTPDHPVFARSIHTERLFQNVYPQQGDPEQNPYNK